MAICNPTLWHYEEVQIFLMMQADGRIQTVLDLTVLVYGFQLPLETVEDSMFTAIPP